MKNAKKNDDGLAAACASVGLKLVAAPVCKRPGIETDISVPGCLSPRAQKRLADAATAELEAALAATGGAA